MKDLDIVYSHTLESYCKRLNDQPKTFFGKNDTNSSEFTGRDWGVRDQKLAARKKRVKLSVD